ncbi:major facilitator superfamily domain-containing protein [Radiomyces spectabilis]|uniref:major facilitator superfamily domain-containing protein n=1 Tax=Radiomyces spectabilis TaxID=64574 RepID=UPI002220F8A3|nr:major facilitator superfamily domain-containing protein [Radiomyces spectabilis]KAI8394332.1 major facilitator superfamily domain-containing protein [Radiomyces spectabilis]
MQDYFEQNKFPNSALELSFVGTLALVFTNLMGPFTQILTSMFGSRIVLMTGTVLVTLALIVAGFSSQIWHLYLTQGIMFGIGASMMYVTIMGVAPQWFTRRRGLALGMVASGSGIGGLVIPFIMTPINSSLGYAWTYRILGFICLACDLVAVVLVKEKFPRKKGRKKLSDIVQLNVLRNFNFILWCVGSVIMLLGYFVPYFFLPSYATFHGLSASQGSALVAVSSAMNFIGRVLAGICADHIGKLNTNIIFTIIGGLSSLLIWTFATNYGSLMAYSVVFGLFCGSYFALLSPVTAFILGMEKFPSGLSVLLLFNVIAVFGPNIASAIENGVSAEPFLSYKLFSGVAYLVGACILTFLKLRLNRNIFAKI